MRRGKRLAAVILSAAMVVASLSLPGGKISVGAAETAETTGTTETEGFRNIDAKTITEEMGAGWNLGNQMESVNAWSGSEAFPDETAYGNPVVKRELIDAVKEQGFKSVRIPVSYLTMIGSEKEGYKIDLNWLDRVEEIVDYVIENDMYAIINIHGDGYSTVKGGWLLPGLGDNQQEIIKAKYKACWEQIANRFKDHNEKLIFESMNEVGADAKEDSKKEVTAYYKNINAYNQIFVDTVRQSGGNNDKRWLLIPGINTNASLTNEKAGFVLPTDQYRSDTIPKNEQRIMVSVHYYAPWTFCGQEDYMTTQWGMESTDDSRAATEGLELDMEQIFADLNNDFVKRGYPVVIGEYGCVDKSQIKPGDITSGKFNPDDVDAKNNEYRAYYTEVLNMMAKRYNCIPVYWDNGYNGAFGLGLFDRYTYKVTQPEIIRAIMKIYTASNRNVRELKLDQKSLRLYMGDDGTKLKATVTPKASEGNIIWESADPTIAAVSQRGTVVPKDVGTTVITASVGGRREYCIVHVSPAQRFRAKLYYNSVSGGWNYATLASKDYVSVEAGQGGTYTLKLTGPQERMKNINTLYLKDLLGNDGKIKNSLISKAKVKIDSLKMNEFEATMTKDEFVFDASDKDSSGIFDICLLNVWDESYAQEFKPNTSVGGSFPESAYVEGTNTITLTFTLSDVVQSDNKVEEIEPTLLTLPKESVGILVGAETELETQLEPENTTYRAVWVSDDPDIATVTSAGKLTGVAEGVVTLHAFTGNGMEKTCTVNVIAGTGNIGDIHTAILVAESLNKEDYTEDSYGKLEEALQEAKAVLETENPDSGELDRAQGALEDAINHLLKKDTYDRVIEMLDDELPEENYSQESWALYQKQIQDIRKQLSEGTLTQQELEDILQNLDTMRKGILTRKTQNDMAAAIEEAKKYQSAEYTAESWKKLEDALNAAENAYQDASVGEDQMQQLLAALQAAVNGLQKAGTATQNPGTSQPPAGTSNPGTVNQPPAGTLEPGAVNQPPTGTKAPTQGTKVSASKVRGKKMTLSKVKSPKKKTIQITWKKLAGASGYQIRLATNKKMTKGKKTVVVKKASTTKKAVKKLKAGKKYYVR
ncbi:MAG: cellulase family glycosylhydrolase, partial [Lachnospiraceae bacterium]|nr:cellulase family glycosylhydrolase [Lachnospiraceae bacterium]